MIRSKRRTTFKITLKMRCDDNTVEVMNTTNMEDDMIDRVKRVVREAEEATAPRPADMDARAFRLENIASLSLSPKPFNTSLSA